MLAALSFLPLFRGHEDEVGDLPARHFDALAIVALALLCLPLAVRRRYPAVGVGLVSLGFVVAELGTYRIVAATALPIALLSAGAHLRHHRRLAAAVLTGAYLGLAVVLHLMGAPEQPTGYLAFYLLGLALPWGVGAWLRATRAMEADRRERVAGATRTAERTRIARELHDVVTHHVTAMVVQAEAARYLTAAPDRLDETLTAVTDTGRRAISDLRRLLDVLNPDHETDNRLPSVGELRTLVEQTRRAGQPVEFSEEGGPVGATGSAEVVAYRVVQEALTNALKYAHGSRTVVRVRYCEGAITVGVSNDGSGSGTRSPGGGGRGLAGLRERVDALGGEFRADPRTGGGFVVQARIPAGSPS
jgi:signal transduction histidine kinase